MTFDYWFMFPIAIVIATTAMASGVEGAAFFTPLFILVLGFPPEVAIGTGLITAVFGTASGVTAYAYKQLIDYRLGGTLLITTIPMGILGTGLSTYLYPNVLKAALAIMLVAVATSFRGAFGPTSRAPGESQTAQPATVRPLRQIMARNGETFRYPEPNLPVGRAITAVGGLFLGLISTGLGQLNGYYLIQRSQVPGKVAVATSVFIVAVTALIASTGHLVRFVSAGGITLHTVLNVVVFTIPGVLIGGQVGPMLANSITQRTLKRSLAVLFLTIAILLLIEISPLTANAAYVWVFPVNSKELLAAPPWLHSLHVP